MDGIIRTSQYYAVLIGINSYKQKPLYGCVKDVETLEQYLLSKSPLIYIDKFVANTPTGPQLSSSVLSEPLVRWPTYENITSCLQKLADVVQSGDWVHIHYSGHGTRIEGSSVYSNTDTGDLALALLDENGGTETHYLHGIEFAGLLHKLSEKGVKLNVVLDCCFSSSVLRREQPESNNVRYLKYAREIDAAHKPTLDPNFVIHYQQSLLRDGSMLPNWLIRPVSYTILTACGPHEVAVELEFEDDTRRGALSFFLLRTLYQLGNGDRNNRSIYRHVCARFHAAWPRQNPGFYGNTELSFFGQLKSDIDPIAVPVFRTGTGQLCIKAGQAHGVSQGCRYKLHPFVSPRDVENDAAKCPSVEAIVSVVRGVTSELKGLDDEPLPQCVNIGWTAKPLSQISIRKIPIKISPGVSNANTMVNTNVSERSLDLHTDNAVDVPVLFNVAITDQNEFEIQNEFYERIMSLPKIPRYQTGSWDTLKRFLEHLTRFKQIEGLQNEVQMPLFTDSFRIQLTSSSSSDADTLARALTVPDNGLLRLTVENNSEHCSYIHVYDMGPSWQVQNLMSAEYFTLPPRKVPEGFTGKWSKKLRMTIPESLKKLGLPECEDIFKVFITRQPTSFSALELAKLPNEHAETMRGSPSSELNELPTFFTQLALNKYRVPAEEEQILEDWAVYNFRVRVVAGDTT